MSLETHEILQEFSGFWHFSAQCGLSSAEVSTVHAGVTMGQQEQDRSHPAPQNIGDAFPRDRAPSADTAGPSLCTDVPDGNFMQDLA